LANDFNPYQAPDAPVVEDFIAVEPRRRSTGRFVTAATCFSGAAFLISIVLLVGGFMIANPPAHPPSNIRMPVFLLLVQVASATLAFLLAGRSFWRARDRQGVILFLIAVGSFASIFLDPWLFNMTGRP
jgi:hypothetical protein